MNDKGCAGSALAGEIRSYNFVLPSIPFSLHIMTCVCMELNLNCIYNQVQESSTDAEWRHDRWDTNRFLAAMLAKGAPVSPIFSVFGVFNYLFRIDWLHAVDQGVGPDFLGNLFVLLLEKMQGRNMEERVETLWQHMQIYYTESKCEDKLKELYLKTFRPAATQPPKLKSSAAECRSLDLPSSLLDNASLVNLQPVSRKVFVACLIEQSGKTIWSSKVGNEQHFVMNRRMAIRTLYKWMRLCVPPEGKQIYRDAMLTIAKS